MRSRTRRGGARARTGGSRPAGLRDIAEAVGTSIGTVDRALHGRGRISPDTRARVLAAAEALGYRPNVAARYLSARKTLRIGVCLPRAVASFYSDVREGILGAAAPLERSGIALEWHDFPRLGAGEAEALQSALDADPGGLIVAPGDPVAMAPLIDEAVRRRVPVVCVTTDAPTSRRLAAITVDPRTSGSLVGELLGRFIGRPGRIAVVSGSLATSDHREKLAGLEHACRVLAPGLRIVAVVEAHTDAREARRKTKELLTAHPSLDGIYVATANSIPVLREVMHVRRERLTVVTTDLFPELVPFIERGIVDATIHHRPHTQGRLAFDVLRRYIVEHVEPPPVMQLSPHVVLRSNLHLFGIAGASGERHGSRTGSRL